VVETGFSGKVIISCSTGVSIVPHSFFLLMSSYYACSIGFLVFLWSLCCLSFFDLLHLITSLVSSSFSIKLILTLFIFFRFCLTCLACVDSLLYCYFKGFSESKYASFPLNVITTFLSLLYLMR
jgi:hypothetical protein